MDSVLSLFEKHDVEGSGQISGGDFAQILSSLGLDEKDISILFKAAGASRDNGIDYREMFAFLQNKSKPLLACATEVDFNVIVTLLSGESLPAVRTDSSWTVIQLKRSLAKHIDKGTYIKELSDGERVLQEGQTLKDLGFASGADVELQAVLSQRPCHPYWDGEFLRYSCFDRPIQRILVIDTKSAVNTIKAIRAIEEEYEGCEVGEEGEAVHARVQFVHMVTAETADSRTDRIDSSDEKVIVSPDQSCSDPQFIVGKCQSLGIDAVLVASGSVQGSDPHLVHQLKVTLAQAGLEILVCGPSLSVEPQQVPSGSWDSLSTTPPPGARFSDVLCLHCNTCVEAVLSEHMSAHIHIKTGIYGTSGYTCTSWAHCSQCGAAVDRPRESRRLIDFSRAYVFRSSQPDAGDTTFALHHDGDGIFTIEAAQVSGAWVKVGSNARDDDMPLILLEEADSFKTRLNALCFEETTEPRPGQPITFRMYGYRKLSEQEAQAKAAANNEDDEEDEEELSEWQLREEVHLKSGKWLGVRWGIEWDDGETWTCLGMLKYEPEEE